MHALVAATAAAAAGTDPAAATDSDSVGCGWSISGEDRLAILQEHAHLLDIPLGDGAGAFTRDINIYLQVCTLVCTYATDDRTKKNSGEWHFPLMPCPLSSYFTA